jgi:hypothetical protein
MDFEMLRMFANESRVRIVCVCDLRIACFYGWACVVVVSTFYAAVALAFLPDLFVLSSLVWGGWLRRCHILFVRECLVFQLYLSYR